MILGPGLQVLWNAPGVLEVEVLDTDGLLVRTSDLDALLGLPVEMLFLNHGRYLKVPRVSCTSTAE
jgi:hypothetical protein